MATVITEGKGQKYLLVLFLSNLIILTGIQFYRPGWVMDYPDRFSQFIDFLLTNCYTVVLVYFFILATMKQYHRERSRVETEKRKTQESNAVLHEQQLEIMSQNEELNSMNDKVEAQNAVLTMSITAALSIQKTILPKRAVMEQYFQYSVVYKPKDVVSGDFYWFASVGKFQFVAVVDCTGHGVPGAFMSLISHRLLTEIIETRNVYEPGRILTRLNTSVRTTLQQDITTDHNGLDICLCRIENSEDKKQILYAGAKCPLYHYSVSDRDVYKVDADRKSIGGVKYKKDFNFMSKVIDFEVGDKLFLSSDGYIDQSNNSRARYGSVRFYDLLVDISPLPVTEIKTHFKEELEAWSENSEQRDDITILTLQL